MPKALGPLPFLIHIDGVSDLGQKRVRNEDSFTVFPDVGMAVVADGMGGHPGGDVASQTATREVGALLNDRLPLPPEAWAESDLALADLGQTMEAAVMAAHAAIQAQGKADPTLAGMGTTVTAMAIDPLSGNFGIGHVGDSRAYRFREGDLLQLTRDDTWVQERVEHEDLTPEQAKRHPFGHLLTQCVGLDAAPEPHVITGQAEAGDLYLLCSDGLVGMLEEDAMVDLLGDAAGEGPLTIAQRLVDAANKNGGLDNITAALLIVTNA